MDNSNQTSKTGVGTIIGIVIVVVILIVGAIYTFGGKNVPSSPDKNNITSTTTAVETVSDEASVAGIQNDLNSIDVKNLDIDANSI